jgi:hypothetical protein
MSPAQMPMVYTATDGVHATKELFHLNFSSTNGTAALHRRTACHLRVALNSDLLVLCPV